jgi:hypothetical protein
VTQRTSSGKGDVASGVARFIAEKLHMVVV